MVNFSDGLGPPVEDGNLVLGKESHTDCCTMETGTLDVGDDFSRGLDYPDWKEIIFVE